jgi:glutathione peroxidase
LYRRRRQENSNGQEILNALKFVRPGNGFEPKAIMFDKVQARAQTST